MVPPFFPLSTFALLLLSLAGTAFSQDANSPCPGVGVDTQYTDGNGVSYDVWCGYDANSGANNQANTASFEACMQLCDSSTYPQCVHVTWANGACYLKNSYSGMSATGGRAGVHSAAKCSVAGTPPYPAPVARAVNASSGCGKLLPSGLTPGGQTMTYDFTASDGTPRSYRINVPASYDVNKAAPLIFAFHGKGDGPANIEGSSQYSQAIYNPYGIAVYPYGVNVSINRIPVVSCNI